MEDAQFPFLDLFAMGETRDEAEENLKEVIRLFLTSCYERGTLNDVVGECIESHDKVTRRYKSLKKRLRHSVGNT
jgi:predicted RNase H-like HicB family nuclease